MSTLRFANGAYFRASGTRDAFGGASDHLVREGYDPITVVSGDREYAEQVAIFLLRYVQAGDVRGHRVYDVRYWNGVAWYRISPDGTVAVPGTSNHESRRAGDLAYPYNNRNTAAHRRLQQIAHLYGLKWTGVNFGEDWHWENVGALGAIQPAASAASTPEKELTMTEAFVVVPSGAVVHLFPGGRHVFTSQQEYEAYRGEVVFLRDRAGADFLTPPPLDKVVNVTWATFERLRKNCGVPDDDAFQEGIVDVEALAKKLAAKLNLDAAAIRAAVKAELAKLTLKAG